MTDDMIDHRVDSGRLYRVLREAYAVGHGAIGRNGWMLAAVLACGDGTIVSHGSAAELLGLWGARPVLVHVIGTNQGGRKIDGIRWHRASLLGQDETIVTEGIPSTNVARTLVDLAGSLGRQSLRRMVEQAAVLRQLDIAAIDRVLAQGRRRGAPQLREILIDWRSQQASPRLRSLLEARLFPALAAAGLPRPRCNVKLRVEGEPLEWADSKMCRHLRLI